MLECTLMPETHHEPEDVVRAVLTQDDLTARSSVVLLLLTAHAAITNAKSLATLTKVRQNDGACAWPAHVDALGELLKAIEAVADNLIDQ